MVSLIQWFPRRVSSMCPFHPPACSLWSSCAWNDSHIKKPSFQIIPLQIMTLVLQFSHLLRFPFILHKLLLVLFLHINQIFSQLFSSIYSSIERQSGGKCSALLTGALFHSVFPFDLCCSNCRICSHPEILFSEPSMPFLFV